MHHTCTLSQGSLPDMTATTGQYLELSNLYRAKAEADYQAVLRHVQALLVSLGRGKDEISPKSVRMFCSNARNVRYVVGLLWCSPWCHCCRVCCGRMSSIMS